MQRYAAACPAYSCIPAYAASTPANVLAQFERPPSVARKFVEGCLYVSVLNSLFVQTTGAWQIPYFGAGVVIVTAIACFAIFLGQGERFPLSVWFAAAINIGATISQAAQGEMPIVGTGLTFLFLWACQLYVMCYLVRNGATQKRIMLFFSLLILVAAWQLGDLRRVGATRLFLDRQRIGGGIANANDLAHTAGLFALAVLFWSLRATRAARPALWAIGLSLITVVLLTVSRGGIVSMVVGLTTLAPAILLGRGRRVGGIVMLVFGVMALSQLGYFVADAWSAFGMRMEQKSERAALYSWTTVEDLWRTKLLGAGTDRNFSKSTAMGTHAHNTFVNVHLQFGGITAWPYLIWILLLCWRVFRFTFRRDIPMDLRMECVGLLWMMLLAHLFSNFGFVFLSSMYGTAVIEKYTVPSVRSRQKGTGGMATTASS